MQKGFMKKLVATLLSTIAVFSCAATIAGCNPGESAPETSKVVTGDVNPVAYDGSEVTISFYHTMGQKLRAVLDRKIEKFNLLYPNIKVYHQSYGDYPGLRDQISKEITVSKAPSLAFCYPDHVAMYNNAKVTLPMDGFIEASNLNVTDAKGNTTTVGFTQAELNDFVPAYYAEGKVYGDGKMYTLPFAKSSEVLYYNKTFFDAHPEYKVPTTWDEVEEVCEQMIAADTTGKLIPLGYDSEANWFITMCEQLESPYTSATKGEYFLFNNEENREFVQKIRNWYKKGYIITEELNSGSYTSDLFKQTDMKKNHTYMSIGSSAGASYQCPNKIEGTNNYPFEVGVAMLPQANPENQKVISQGPSICMFKKANEQEMAAAWVFTKFLTTNVELQADYSIASGYACAIQSVEQDEIYQNFLETADGNLNLQASCVKLTTSEAYKNASFISPAFVGSSKARDEVGLLLKNACLNNPTGTQTEEEFIEEMFVKLINKLNLVYEAE